MIHALVHLTAPRFTTQTPSIPSIDVTADAPRKRLVGPEEHKATMAAAHALAARIWARNEAGWPVAVESLGTAHARITVETIDDDDAERRMVLKMLRDVVAPKSEGVAYRPDGTAITVTIPR